MYVYMYVYIYICVCVCVYIYVYIYIYTCVCVYIYIHTHIYIQKTTSRLDTETTPHHSDIQDSETLPNSASISGPLKKLTLTTIFHGVSFHQDHPTTAQTKDATSASEKNYSSLADPNCHHSINVMSSCPHAATETKRNCVTIEVLFLCKFIKYINDGTKILNNKIP